MMAEKKQKDKTKTVVVAELPQQNIRTFEEEGKSYELITIDEALTEIIESIRHIKKSIA